MELIIFVICVLILKSCLDVYMERKNLEKEMKVAKRTDFKKHLVSNTFLTFLLAAAAICIVGFLAVFEGLMASI